MLADAIDLARTFVRYLGHVVFMVTRHPREAWRMRGTLWPVYWSMWKLRRIVRPLARNSLDRETKRELLENGWSDQKIVLADIGLGRSAPQDPD